MQVLDWASPRAFQAGSPVLRCTTLRRKKMMLHLVRQTSAIHFLNTSDSCSLASLVPARGAQKRPRSDSAHHPASNPSRQDPPKKARPYRSPESLRPSTPPQRPRAPRTPPPVPGPSRSRPVPTLRPRVPNFGDSDAEASDPHPRAQTTRYGLQMKVHSNDQAVRSSSGSSRQQAPSQPAFRAVASQPSASQAPPPHSSTAPQPASSRLPPQSDGARLQRRPSSSADPDRASVDRSSLASRLIGARYIPPHPVNPSSTNQASSSTIPRSSR